MYKGEVADRKCQVNYCLLMFSAHEYDATHYKINISKLLMLGHEFKIICPE